MKRLYRYITALSVAAACLSACNQEIVVDKVDEDAYGNVVNLYATLRDANTNRISQVVDLRKSPYSTRVACRLSRPPKKGVDLTVRYDAAYVETYNAEHGTSFRAFPEASMRLQNDGKIVAAPDETETFSLGLVLEPFDDDEEATYLLPLQAVSSTDGVSVSEAEGHLVYLVKNLRGQSMVTDPEGDDATRKQVIVFFEVNNTNPLNALQFETEDGHLLIDYLVLFAYNINYDTAKGEPYVFSNPQCQYILDHYDEVIKPLRDRGMKVIVSVLGNHDPAGLAQLSDLGARDFAGKMADLCYGYGFDGVNYDDEYSGSPDLSNPLLAPHTTAAGNRLYFETKKRMPDKVMLSYQYGSALGNAAVDGIEPGEYMDICVGDYGRSGVAYTGMTLSQCAFQSSEFAQWRYAPTQSSVQNFMNSDYGYWMVFSLWNNIGSAQRDWTTMNILAEAIYGSPLKKPAIYYPETKSLETRPITW